MLKTIILATALSLSAYDGDTLTVNGEHYRIVGYDTPEMHSKCPTPEGKKAEVAKAIEARNELLMLVREPSAQLVEQQCVGWNFGRKCARILVDGTDIAGHMVSIGLAHAYKCIGKCPRRLSWCSR